MCHYLLVFYKLNFVLDALVFTYLFHLFEDLFKRGLRNGSGHPFPPPDADPAPHPTLLLQVEEKSVIYETITD